MYLPHCGGALPVGVALVKPAAMLLRLSSSIRELSGAPMTQTFALPILTSALQPLLRSRPLRGYNVDPGIGGPPVDCGPAATAAATFTATMPAGPTVASIAQYSVSVSGSSTDGPEAKK